MGPEQLREIAQTWRNIASAANDQATFMRTVGLSGSLVYHAEATVLHASSCAEQLEERAAELEKMGGPS